MTAVERGSRAAEGEVESPRTAWLSAGGAPRLGHTAGFPNEVLEEKRNFRSMPGGTANASCWLPVIFGWGERWGLEARSSQALRLTDCADDFNESVVEPTNREEALPSMRARARDEQPGPAIRHASVRSPCPLLETFLSPRVPSPLHIRDADQERGTIPARLMLILARAVGSPADWFGL
jgi:hypothetical protein